MYANSLGPAASGLKVQFRTIFHYYSITFSTDGQLVHQIEEHTLNPDGKYKQLEHYIRNDADHAIAVKYFRLIKKFLRIDPHQRIISKYSLFGQFKTKINIY